MRLEVGSSSTSGGGGGGGDGREKENGGWLADWLAGAAAAKERKGKGKGRGKGKVASWRNASAFSVAAAGLSISTLIHN